MCSNTENSFSGSISTEKSLFEKRFLRLTDEGVNFDCSFIVGTENAVVSGHKLLFSAASKVFCDMFYGDLKNEETVEIEGLDPEGFEGMKQFIYTGEVNFTSAIHALFTYIAARKYLIALLMEKCIRFIKDDLKTTDVLEFYELCKITNVSEFDELCSEIIQQKTDQVVDSEYFVTAKHETIEMILQSPVLNLRSEFDVFHHFRRWAIAEAKRKGYSVDELASNFNNLKKYIRFLTIDADEFVSKIGQSLLLTAEERSAILAFNQLKSDLIQMPYLSLERQTRDFIVSKSKNYKYEQKFEIITDEPSYDLSYDFDIRHNIGRFFGVDLVVGCCSIFNDGIFNTIYFHVTPAKRFSINRLLKMKFELRIVAKDNKCDDLVIDNTCYILISDSDKICADVNLAEISAKQLTDFADENKKLTVVLSYDFERIQ